MNMRNDTNDPPLWHGIRSGRTFFLATGLMTLALLAAACGGGPLGSTPAASASSSPSPSFIAFAACMRSHGLPDFQDPGGNATIQTSPPDTNTPQYKSAQNACKSLMPTQGAGGDQGQAQNPRAALQFAQCMRSNGVPNFPDPTGTSGAEISRGSGLNPNDPTFQAAQTTCQHYLSAQPAPANGTP